MLGSFSLFGVQYVCINYWMRGRNPAYLRLDQTDMYIRGMGGWDRQTDKLGMGGWVDCRNGWMGGRQMANHRGEYIPYIPCLNCYNTYML